MCQVSFRMFLFLKKEKIREMGQRGKEAYISFYNSKVQKIENQSLPVMEIYTMKVLDQKKRHVAPTI